MTTRPYRAKREDNGHWVEGCYLLFTRGIDGDLHIIVDATGQYNRIDPETLGQSTGYTDNLGRIVYEGDIVSYEFDTGAVRYDDKLAAFVVNNEENETDPDMFFELENVDIIGNIHEMQMRW